MSGQMRRFKRPSPMTGTTDSKVERLRLDLIVHIDEVEREIQTLRAQLRALEEADKKRG